MHTEAVPANKFVGESAGGGETADDGGERILLFKRESFKLKFSHQDHADAAREGSMH